VSINDASRQTVPSLLGSVPESTVREARASRKRKSQVFFPQNPPFQMAETQGTLSMIPLSY
jgi:hypothetical protein